MKKLFFFFVLIVCIIHNVFAQTDITKTFLQNFFSEKEYVLEEHSFDDGKFYVAHNIIQSDKDFFSKAILFRECENGIIPMEYVNASSVYNGHSLYRNIISGSPFYAWKIEIENDGIYLRYFMNGGKEETDGIHFIWRNNNFIRLKVDPSLY